MTAGIAIATLYPLGFYLLVRAYEMGDGHYPQFWFNAGLAAVGVLVAFGAAARAQAVPGDPRGAVGGPCTGGPGADKSPAAGGAVDHSS